MAYRKIFVLGVVGLFGGCQDVHLHPPTMSRMTFNAAGAPTVEFSLPDMMCEDGCAMAVEDILARQPGAKEVQVDFEGKKATVAFEEGAFDAQQALAALVDKGFDHSSLKNEADAESPELESASLP
jgi:copper chaperone CopZ